MLSAISLLTALVIAVIYPLCFWISFKNPIKHNFHHFHLGFPTVLAGIVTAFIFMGSFSDYIRLLSLVWLVGLLGISLLSWRRESIHPVFITPYVLVGLIVFFQVQGVLTHSAPIAILNFVGLLAGLILCTVLFAMNLGHFYLNVHGLPIEHLRRANHALSVFLCIRLVYDVYALLTERIIYREEEIGAFTFITTMDGVFVWIAILFGVVFPLISMYFVYGTLKLKNTQSATGILYVILASILLGDLTYKYYLIKFGLIL